jgi:hypothetical protein
MEKVEFKQWEHGYDNLVGMPEMIDDSGKIAHGAEESMQQKQGLTLPFLYKLEFIVLFYLKM